MIRHELSLGVLTLVVVAGSCSAAFAQEFGRSGFGGGGIPSTEESFRRMDRNGNDTIDPEEWETIPGPIRRAYEDLADLSQPMGYDDFVEVSQKMREQLMSRFSEGRGGDFGRGGSFGRRDRSRDDSNEGDSPMDDRDGGRRRSRGGFGGSDESSGPNAENSAKKPERLTSKSTKPRTPINIKLPEQFRSRDKDRDGQIGLYEWPRNDYGGFRKLDLNGDGFLTPQELVRAGSGSVASAVSNATLTSSAGSAPSADSSQSASSSGPGIDGRAETAFRLLDKNKDGSVSEEEWMKSLSARPAFEKAGVTVSLPISRKEFIRLFPQAYPPTGK